MHADLLVEGTQKVVELESQELMDVGWQGKRGAYKNGRTGDEGAPN